ncbi:unnamed protein product [Adineta ricciae]|uniref:Transcription elongation factor TFIIS/CRSP70 N-terminal sub-type domain-containing protein n=1 Tax=Adineta ricciae TaxID=249248 RepID=A0A814CS04_ADIRI|nr:unnamed protein product [Adineta ricciae]CAF0947195.1 unnamed protein product [Adineta ricciae]
MSNEPVILTVETVQKKLKKYIALKEPAKVKEYLRKLYHTSVTSSLIQETRIDSLLRRLASHKTANYSSSARRILKKWHHKRLLPPKSTINTNTTANEKRLEESSESPTSDDTKKRKVLSLAQYLETKKHVSRSTKSSSSLSLTTTTAFLNETRQNKLTDTQIEIINAQFKATTEKLTASVPDLAKIVNKTLIETEKRIDNRLDSIAKRTNIEQPKPKVNDLWAEEDDDDDDDDDDDVSVRSEIFESKTVNSNDSFHIQKVR